MDYYVISGIGVAMVGAASYLASRWRHRVRTPEADAGAAVLKSAEPAVEAPARPEVSELSSLPDSDRKKLLGAIWYRCENPHCNHSKFLDVYHVVPELEGGSHSLDNLIVLCSACQTAARKREIKREQLKSWIRPREERFKCDFDWRYKR